MASSEVPIRWGPRWTDLSGNPAQRYLRLLVNVAKSAGASSAASATADWRCSVSRYTGETVSPRPTPPTRRSPSNSDATPAPPPRSLRAGWSLWTVEARGNRRRGLRQAGRHDRGRVPASHPRGARRGGHRSREHLGGPRRRSPRPHAAGTHGHRPPPRDVAEELDLSRLRMRQLQRRAEDALRAETPANLALAAGG